MKVKIFKPAKSAMQSGLGKTGAWVIECERPSRLSAEPLMGWTASGDTLGQVRLSFDSFEKATEFAQGKGWEYTTSSPRQRTVRPRNYADNFKYTPPEKSGG
jgi:hypothetical protein